MTRPALYAAPADPSVPGCLIDEDGLYYAPGDETQGPFLVSPCCHAACTISFDGRPCCKKCYGDVGYEILGEPRLPFAHTSTPSNDADVAGAAQQAGTTPSALVLEDDA